MHGVCRLASSQWCHHFPLQRCRIAPPTTWKSGACWGVNVFYPFGSYKPFSLLFVRLYVFCLFGFAFCAPCMFTSIWVFFVQCEFVSPPRMFSYPSFVCINKTYDCLSWMLVVIILRYRPCWLVTLPQGCQNFCLVMFSSAVGY